MNFYKTMGPEQKATMKGMAGNFFSSVKDMGQNGELTSMLGNMNGTDGNSSSPLANMLKGMGGAGGSGDISEMLKGLGTGGNGGDMKSMMSDFMSGSTGDQGAGMLNGFLNNVDTD